MALAFGGVWVLVREVAVCRQVATLTRNVVRLGRDRLTTILATPTRTQHRTLDLLGVTPTA
jgi:hypothetical protein